MDINKLRELFEDNFEELKFETGRSITSNMKEYAWQQVKLYYEKLGEVAKNITETDVKLILPEQVTPKGRKYTIEGNVNIGREKDKITMYHIKPHNCQEIEKNKDIYREQLNLYAHMWKKLRNTPIDKMAIIATAPSEELKEAINIYDKNLTKSLINSWNPIVPVPFNEEEVKKQLQSFGETVDKIQDGQFRPPSLEKLNEIKSGQKSPFKIAVCRHCDARYSCSVYEKSATYLANR